MAADDWTVRPRRALGRLTFGMSPAEVDALSDVYGAATGRMADRIPDDLLRDTLEQFGDALSDEEKRGLIAAYADLGPPADAVTETRGEPGLILGYRADGLVEIMTAAGHRPLYLDGDDVLSLNGANALALLERVNGGPARHVDTEAAFDRIAISVVGFCVADGDVRVLNEDDERFRGRTVTLRMQSDH